MSKAKNNIFHRLNKEPILEDLKKKIVLLTGPRQVGKTWPAKKIMDYYKNPIYLNYDSFKDKKIIHDQSWPESSDIIVFDEIHKMDEWKNYIKGIFDTRPSHLHMLVTGSAQLQRMNRSGDSLAGRCFSHTLLPFSLFELGLSDKSFKLNKLLNRSGFPQPLLILKNEDEIGKWKQQYLFSLIREDIPDYRNLQNYKKMETLLYLLRENIGSPLSIESLRQSLKIDHKTASKYITILEDLYIIFQIPCYSKKISRSLSKLKKAYFYDYSFIESSNKGNRLENLVALHLLRHCTYLKENFPSRELNLFYLKTKDQKEVDFVLTKKRLPTLMIEVKTKDVGFSKGLIYFHDKYGIPGKQISLNLKRPLQIKDKKIYTEDIQKFLINLNT